MKRKEKAGWVPGCKENMNGELLQHGWVGMEKQKTPVSHIK
ncbi:hypothetical protein EVAR_71996_1, partial [Eumeta japonica]